MTPDVTQLLDELAAAVRDQERARRGGAEAASRVVTIARQLRRHGLTISRIATRAARAMGLPATGPMRARVYERVRKRLARALDIGPENLPGVDGGPAAGPLPCSEPKEGIMPSTLIKKTVVTTEEYLEPAPEIDEVDDAEGDEDDDEEEEEEEPTAKPASVPVRGRKR